LDFITFVVERNDNVNSRVLHPVARVSLKFIKVQTPPYATSVLVFHSFLFLSHYMFRPIYRPSSGMTSTDPLKSVAL
jgi:hypothetical protein